MTRYLTLDDAVQVIDRLGFIPRDLGLLASALARPATTLGADDAYTTLAGKGAALLESVVRNHALIDGNKRTGWVLTSLFFWINGIRLDADHDAAFDLVVRVARGDADLEFVEAARASWCARRDLNPRPIDP